MSKRKPKNVVKLPYTALIFHEDGSIQIASGKKIYDAVQVEVDDEEYFKIKQPETGHVTWVSIDYGEL